MPLQQPSVVDTSEQQFLIACGIFEQLQRFLHLMVVLETRQEACFATMQSQVQFSQKSLTNVG